MCCSRLYATHNRDKVRPISQQFWTSAKANAGTAAGPVIVDRTQAPIPRSEIDWILQSLDADKAEDIVAIDLQGKSAIADWMIIATGTSSRQLVALGEKLVERLKQRDFPTVKVEGRQTGDWILIDAGDVIVHLFRPEVRAHYGLEKMWDDTGAATSRLAS